MSMNEDPLQQSLLIGQSKPHGFLAPFLLRGSLDQGFQSTTLLIHGTALLP